jgi:hypothetical protein
MIKCFLGVIVRSADFLEQLLHEEARLARPIIRDFPGRRCKHRERPVGRVDGRKTCGRGPEPSLVGVSSRSIDDRDFHARATLPHLAENIVKTETVAFNFWLRPDLRVNRDQIALAR